MRFRGGEFSTGTTGNFQPELTYQAMGAVRHRAHLKEFQKTSGAADEAFHSTMLFNRYDVLLPPASSFSITPIAISSSISRSAVRDEAFVSFIHLSLVSFPSNPLKSLFRTFIRRSGGRISIYPAITTSPSLLFLCLPSCEFQRELIPLDRRISLAHAS